MEGPITSPRRRLNPLDPSGGPFRAVVGGPLSGLGRVLASDERAAAEENDAAHQHGQRHDLSGESQRLEDQPFPEEHDAEQAGNERVDDSQARL